MGIKYSIDTVVLLPVSQCVTLVVEDIHPGRLTWNILMEVWKIMFLSKWVICRFHANLPGCIYKMQGPLLQNFLSDIDTF